MELMKNVSRGDAETQRKRGRGKEYEQQLCVSASLREVLRGGATERRKRK
jgi:hypothetical protein